MTTSTANWLDVDGERIYFESIGEGDPVVLCHGLGGNHAAWWRVVPGLIGHHRVITWDQRGFGNSTRRTGRYGPEVAVGDLGALLDHLGLSTVQLIGQSMGGWVAMGYALRYPERLRSLVLTDTLAGVFTDEIFAEVSRTSSDVLARAMAGGVDDHPALGQRFCAEHPDLAFLYREISSMGDKPDEKEVFGMLGGMRAPLDAVDAMALPVLFVVGEDDQLCPPDAMRHIAGRIPGATLKVLAGAGHSPYFEVPELWLEAVGPFLGAHAAVHQGGAEPTMEGQGFDPPA
ncbi:MAG TPA: alpha/beta hydrolase [Acidimicrobiales bacterium]|nr:alpha/beta hydrolase [Acidimicrobiales bacterium]